MPVASTTTPAAAVPTSPSPAAPAGIAVDFMAMLGQLGGAVPAPASALVPADTSLPASKDVEELDTAAPESTDMPGMMPLSLPLAPPEAKAGAALAQASTLPAVAPGGVAKAQAEAVALEAQLLTDLIQPEQVSSPGKFELPPLARANESAPSQPPEESAHSRPVNVPVGTAQWADEIGSRMTMMVEQGRHTASLRLSPEHLGPLEVRITLSGDQASVQFGAAHVDTRNAIESALPRLRELFASQGLSLADANVSREPPRQQSNPTPQSSSSTGLSAADDSMTAVSAARVRLGLLDTYA